MNARKRPADDALFPTRVHKLQRTSRDPLPLRARYRQFASDGLRLIHDSFASVMSLVLPVPTPASPSSVSDDSLPTPPRSPSPPHPIHVFSSDTDSSQPDPPRPTRASDPKVGVYDYFASRPSVFVPSSTPTPTQQPIPSPATHSTASPLPSTSRSLPTHDSIVPNLRTLNLASTTSSFSFTSVPSLATSTNPSPSQTPSRSNHSPKRLKGRRERKHIFEKSHKANVLRQRKELQGELQQQLFRIKRKQGYTSGFLDFTGLLDYQRQLSNIGLDTVSRRNPLHLLGRPKFPSKKLQPPEEDDEYTHFLQRTLDNAKATLNGPKPQKPFSPTHDQLRLTNRIKDEEIENRLRPKLPAKLPPEDDAKVDELLRKRGPISKFAREAVSSDDLARLRPGQWLNDEVINFYGAMLLARSDEAHAPGKAKEKGVRPLNVHYFSSFFWSKLVKEGYEKGRLAKWTKKVDIFAKDVVLIPVNHGNSHWTAAAINFRQKRIESYDSMNAAKYVVFKELRQYLEQEHLNKKKKPMDWTGWENWAPESQTPQQENGYDCGVFTCHFLEAVSRGEEMFAFMQRDMPYLRRRMIWEIGHAKLRGGHYS